MRVSLLVIGTFAFAAVACGGGDDSGGPHKSGPAAPAAGADAPQAPPTSAGGPSGPQCPTDLPEAKQLATDAAATDVSFVGSLVYFRVDTHIARVGIDASARTEIYKSDNLVRSFTDASGILTIEADTDGNTTLNVLSLDGAAAMGTPGLPDKTGGALVNGGVPVNLTAASTFIAGSDATSFYLLDDDQDTFYRLDKQTLALTPVATLEGVVSYPQIASGSFWYVRDQKRVFKLDLSPDTQAQPTEIFGIGYDACDLAVGASYAYCSTSGVIEQRDLTGGNPKDVLESAKSKVASPFGAALPIAEGVVVRSVTGDPVLRDVIRAVAASGDEKLVACNRGTITTMATDGKNVAWVEPSGLFAAQR